MKQHFIRQIAMGIAILALMALFSACAGVGTNGGNGNQTISGSVVAVSAQNHSVTLNINGQQKTINGLTDQEISALQGQVGKLYSIQVSQNSDSSYQIIAGTNLTAENTPETGDTPSTSNTPEANQLGSINFTGKVQSASNTSIVVSLPDRSLTLSLNSQTDRSDFNNTLPTVGQIIKVEAMANADGSFVALKLSQADSGDVQAQNVVDFSGVTTSAVSTDHMIHFQVGNQSFSYAIGANADLGDFNGNAQSIGNKASVKVEVTFNGATGTATKVSNANS